MESKDADQCLQGKCHENEIKIFSSIYYSLEYISYCDQNTERREQVQNSVVSSQQAIRYCRYGQLLKAKSVLTKAQKVY